MFSIFRNIEFYSGCARMHQTTVKILLFFTHSKT